MRTKPYKFQIQGVRRIKRFKGRALLADEMGLGKTLSSLLYAEEEKDNIKTIVVVCPASTKYHWEEEARKHLGMRAEVLSGRKTPKYKRRLVNTSKLVIINWDILKDWIKHLLRLKPDLLILDEIHYAKTRKAQRTRAAKKMARRAKRVLGLSGTPLLNRPAELWQPLNIIRPDLFPNFTEFGWEFCKPHKSFGKWQFDGAANLDKLHDILETNLMIRRRKEDVFRELPKRRHYMIPMEIEDRPQYNRAVGEFLGWLREQEGAGAARKAAAAEGLSHIGYLKRLAAKLKMKFVLEWIDNFLEEADGKLVIFAHHKAIIKMMRDRYKDICVVIDGSVRDKKRQDAVRTFRTKKHVRLAIGNIVAMGTGTDGLQVANTAAFVELDWSPGVMDQAIGRIDRIGQKNHMDIYFLVARGTIEETLCRKIQAKQETLVDAIDGGKPSEYQMKLFDWLQEEILKSAKPQKPKWDRSGSPTRNGSPRHSRLGSPKGGSKTTNRAEA